MTQAAEKTPTVLAIDPGTENSAWVLWDGSRILEHGLEINGGILRRIEDAWFDTHGRPDILAIEKVASYGMPVGAEIFETVFWSGRFAQAWTPGEVLRVPRLEIKLHHCHSPKANDSTVRQGLIDRLGAPGTKKAPGPTYGVTKDVWAALALAVCVWDRLKAGLAELDCKVPA